MLAPGLKSVVLQKFPDLLTEEVAGCAPDSDIRVAVLGYTKNYVKRVKDGSIRVKPAGIASARGNTVTFLDGSKEDFDVIICGTGYKPDLSILPQDIAHDLTFTNKATRRTDTKLYKDALVPAVDNLAFVCVLNSIGSVTSLCEMQARYIAAIFSGAIARPTKRKMKAVVDATVQRRQQSPLAAYPVYVEISEALGDELGVTPSTWQALWSPTKHLFSPVYGCSYRTNPAVEGEEKA